MRLGKVAGATLIELMIVLVIGVIVMLALAIPFASEKTYWRIGSRQVEAQRDAQLILRYIERLAREASSCTVTGTLGNNRVTLVRPGGVTVYFEGGPSLAMGNKLRYNDGATTKDVVDGVRSRVSNFAVTKTNRLMQIDLTITYQNERTEILSTKIFLRNVP